MKRNLSMIPIREKDVCSPPARNLIRSAYENKEPEIAASLGGLPCRTPYSGTLVHSLRETQIEHIVSLGWAAKSGAASWSTYQWKQLAGDMDNLTLALPGENEEKSDNEFLRWMPPRRGAWVWYLLSIVKVVVRHQLSFTEQEHVKMDRLLRDA